VPELATVPEVGPIAPVVAEVVRPTVPEVEPIDLVVAEVVRRTVPEAETIDRVVGALKPGPVVVELERDQAAVGPERVPVVAEPALVRAEVAVTTRSVITERHRELGLLAAEDLAVAVETSLEPVATEAVIVWEAADSMAADVEAADVAAAGDEKGRW
jgi:hypothetical protein